MAQRGRKSAEELGLAAIDVQRQRLKPPAYLKKEERVIFELVVNHSAPMHFKESEEPMLALLHVARFYAGNIGSESDTGHNHEQWVENARLSASLATKLRLTPSTRYDAKQADRYSHEVHADRPYALPGLGRLRVRRNMGVRSAQWRGRPIHDDDRWRSKPTCRCSS